MKTKELRLMRFQHNFQVCLSFAILSFVLDHDASMYFTVIGVVIVLACIATAIDNRRHEQEVRSE